MEHIVPIYNNPKGYIEKKLWKYVGKPLLKRLHVKDKHIKLIEKIVGVAGWDGNIIKQVGLALNAHDRLQETGKTDPAEATPVNLYKWLEKEVGKKVADDFFAGVLTPIKVVVEPVAKWFAPAIPKIGYFLEDSLQDLLGLLGNKSDRIEGYKGVAKATGGSVTQIAMTPETTDRNFKPRIDDSGEMLASMLNNPIVREGVRTAASIFGEGENAPKLEEAAFEQVFGKGVTEEQKKRIRSTYTTIAEALDGDKPLSAADAKALSSKSGIDFGQFGSKGTNANAYTLATFTGEHRVFFADNIVRAVADPVEDPLHMRENFVADVFLEELTEVAANISGTRGNAHPKVEGFENGDIGARFLNFLNASKVAVGDPAKIEIPDIQDTANENRALESDTETSENLGGTVSQSFNLFYGGGANSAVYIGGEAVPFAKKKFTSTVAGDTTTAARQTAFKFGAWIKIADAAETFHTGRANYRGQDAVLTEESVTKVLDNLSNAIVNNKVTYQFTVKNGLTFKNQLETPRSWATASKNWFQKGAYISLGHDGETKGHRTWSAGIQAYQALGVGLDHFSYDPKLPQDMFAGYDLGKTKLSKDSRLVGGLYASLDFQFGDENAWRGMAISVGAYAFSDHRGLVNWQRTREDSEQRGTETLRQSNKVGDKEFNRKVDVGPSIKLIVDPRTTVYQEVGIAWDSYDFGPTTRLGVGGDSGD